MVDARIRDKVVSDAKNAVSLANFEEKLVLAEYVDSQELDKDIKNNLGTAVFNVITKLNDDESKLNSNIIALGNAINDWLGDLQSEIRVAGPQGSRQIYDYFEKIKSKNSELKGNHDVVKIDITELRNLLSVSLTELHGNSNKISSITSLVKSLVSNAKLCVSDVESIKKIIEDLDKYVKEFNAQSPELRNYQNTESKLDDLLEGKGIYQMYSLNQRYDILVRVLRTKSIIKLPDGAQFNSEMLRDTESMRKIKTFMKEYETENQLAMSGLIIENPKHNEWEYYQDSLARLRQKGFKNHLRPIQFYEVLLEHFRTNGLGTHEDVAKNILSGKGEWLSVAFRKKGNTLEISFDPENIAWNKGKEVYDGELRVDASFDIGNKESRKYYKIGEFKQELVTALYGADAGELSKYNAGIYLPPEGSWWPVGTGYNYYGNSRFSLSAYNNQGASRGVR
jgi:hypothetical protein